MFLLNIWQLFLGTAYNPYDVKAWKYSFDQPQVGNKHKIEENVPESPVVSTRHLHTCGVLMCVILYHYIAISNLRPKQVNICENENGKTVVFAPFCIL